MVGAYVLNEGGQVCEGLVAGEIAEVVVGDG